MPILADFSLSRLEDATLTVSMAPPTPIGGWMLRFWMQNRFGGISGFAQAYVSSGYNGQSGINVINSGQGVFSVTIPSMATSGLDYKNYAYAIERLDSGFRTVISEGYVLLLPSVAV